MKKIIITLALIAFAASSAMAAVFPYDVSTAAGSALGTTSTPPFAAKGSKGVLVEYHGATQGYVLGAYHISGTQTYATSSGDTKIWKADVTGADIPGTAPTGTQTANFGAAFVMQ